jgi:hypothetical protein
MRWTIDIFGMGVGQRMSSRGSSTASKVSKDQRHRHGLASGGGSLGNGANEPLTKQRHAVVYIAGSLARASWCKRAWPTEHGRQSVNSMDAAVRRHRAMLVAVGALALAVVARRAPLAGHSSTPSSGCWPSSRSSCPWPSTLPPRHPRAPARPLDLHAVVTMLGAWAAWMAAVTPSSMDATTATSAAACWWPARAATRLAGPPGSAPASSARHRLS